MQTHSQSIRQKIWDKLHIVFTQHSQNKPYLTGNQLQSIISQILGEQGQAEISYVVKHLNKIDTNGNGKIEFGEFANYLLRRYCGELALQRLHRGRMGANGKHRMDCGEFGRLLEEAFRFLGVVVPGDAVNEIFRVTDTDRDGFVSYEEYFRFVETYVCDFQKPTALKSKPSISGPEASEMLLRFRRLLWGELFRIYVKYDSDGNGNMDDQEMTLLLKQLLNQTSKSQLDYVFKNSFRMDANGDNSFVFEQFSVFFIKHACQIGLNRYNKTRATGGRRDISRDDFTQLFKGSFCFLESGLVGDKIIQRVFSKIDKDRDGSISYKEYLQWTNELLAYRESDGLPCFLYQAKIEEVLEPTPMKGENAEVVGMGNQGQTGHTPVKPFEMDIKPLTNGKPPLPNHQLNPSKNPNASIKRDQRGLSYNSDSRDSRVLSDRNNVNHEKTTNGDSKKLLNLNQTTTTHKPDNIQNQYDPHITMTTRQRMKLKLQSINSTNTCFTTQGIKFFQNPKIQPNLIPCLQLPTTKPTHTHFNDASSVRSTTSSVARLFSSKNLAERIKQHTMKLLQTFDKNRNGTVDPEEVEKILVGLLKEKETEIRYVTRNFFRYSQGKKKGVSFEMFTEFFLGLHCGEMAVQRFHGSGMFTRSRDLVMNRQEFIMSFQGALDYIEFLAPVGELKQLFREIDANKDGWISYKEYFEFLKHFFSYLPECTKKAITRNPSLVATPNTSPLNSARSGVLQQQPQDIISSLIRNQTLLLLNKYNTKTFSTDLIRNILHQLFLSTPSQTQKTLTHLPMYSTTNPNLPISLTPQQLLTLLMQKHCGSTILHRLHSTQKFIKHQEHLLGSHDFLVLFDTAFGYLDFKPKREDVMALFSSLDTDGDGYITYRKWLEFVREHLGSYKQDKRRQQEQEDGLEQDGLEEQGIEIGVLAASGVRSEAGRNMNRARAPSATFLKV